MNLASMESRVVWTAFIATFLAVAVWETVLPFRRSAASSGRRWGHHAALVAIALGCSGLLLRVSPVVLAHRAQDWSYGLLNRGPLPPWLRFTLAILLLDCVHYLTHRALHATRWLWRIHEVHHSDPDFDVSSGVRFHPIEVLISQGVSLAAIAALGMPASAVLLSLILETAANFFEHANANMPEGLAQLLGYVLITPHLHRLHHSAERADYDRNFGQLLSIWDRLFGTYAAESASSTPFRTGVKELDADDTVPVLYALVEPFRRRTSTKSASAGNVG